MTTLINADTSGGLKLTSDTSGALDIQSAGSTKLAMDSSGNVDIVGTVTGAAFEPDGDTAAGDNAAVGYTSAEGLILTGQGSTSDVTIKNDADATVMSIPTGSGDVGIGTTAATTYANSMGNTAVVGTGNNWAVIQGRTDGPSGSTNGVNYGGSYATNPINGARMFLGAAGGAGQRGLIVFNTKNLDDDTSQPLERMRIDASGNVGIGLTPSGARAYVKNTTASQAGLIVENNVASYSSALIAHVATSGTRYLMDFRVGGTAGGNQEGTITSTGSGVAYNTSSDYRLKENVSYSFDATTRIKQLKPARFNFIADADKTVDGFLAHEVASIVPEAVTGTKDEMRPEVLYVEGDELPDGKSVGDVKEASAPDYQGIDQSKLVPLLVKTIQELEARIAALEA